MESILRALPHASFGEWKSTAPAAVVFLMPEGML